MPTFAIVLNERKNSNNRFQYYAISFQIDNRYNEDQYDLIHEFTILKKMDLASSRMSYSVSIFSFITNSSYIAKPKTIFLFTIIHETTQIPTSLRILLLYHLEQKQVHEP